MSEIDDLILELLYEIGVSHGHAIAQPPKAIWQNLANELELIDRSPETVRRRMRQLEQADLLCMTEAQGTYYKLTDRGVRYVDGDVTRDELIDGRG